MTRELAAEIPRCPKDGYQLIHGRCPLCLGRVPGPPHEKGWSSNLLRIGAKAEGA